MHSDNFHVDLDELPPIARPLQDAKDDLREHSERMPHQITDVGVSTGQVNAALVALLGGVAGVLDDLTHAHDALSRTYEQYRDTEDRNVTGQQWLLDPLDIPTRHPWTGATAGRPSPEFP